MYSSRNEYDRGVNTFSPQGRLFQVEYALGAVKLGSTSVAIRTKEGVIVATERRVQSKLMEPKCDVEKLRTIDQHIACASAGIIADSRILIDHARVEAQHHRFVYDEPFTVKAATHAIAELALSFSGVYEGRNSAGISRPFGVALLVAGVDHNEGPALWAVDPSGTATSFAAAAVGGAQEGSEALLHEKYQPDMSLQDAEELAMLVLRQAMEETLSANNVEVCRVTAERQQVERYSEEELQQVIGRLPEATVA